jgi:hypothetical protein
MLIAFWVTWPTGNSPHTVSIHVLDDDSLLHIFYLYRPFLLGEDQGDLARLWGGEPSWARGRWWYKLVHVCRRWRSVILGSAPYLELFLVCTNGTHVADMLAYSLPLPLVVDYSGRNIAAKDEEGIILALNQRDRVRRVRFRLPATILQKFIAVIEEEYPILEYLIISFPTEDKSTILIFPEALQAPQLCHLSLRGFGLPIGSRLLTTGVGLVTLHLVMVHPSTYFYPNTLIQWISLMPQLEMLVIIFISPIPGRDVERQLTHMPTIAPVTLPNLRHFVFHGVNTYSEALITRINVPRLEKLRIQFINQLTFFVPCLLQLMNTAENLRFHAANVTFFDHKVEAAIYPHGEIVDAEMYAFAISVYCWHLDWQVSSATQISSLLGQIFSLVENLTFQYEEHSHSSEEHNQVDRTEWRRLLRPFRNVKTIRIVGGLVEELSFCLKLEDGELPLELLPELNELTYYGRGNTGDAFTPFIDARRNAGRPVTLVRL